eukprot:SAG31_NODE_9349_length_1291_cov_1.574664_1_plen_302_part_10
MAGCLASPHPLPSLSEKSHPPAHQGDQQSLNDRPQGVPPRSCTHHRALRSWRPIAQFGKEKLRAAYAALPRMSASMLSAVWFVAAMGCRITVHAQSDPPTIPAISCPEIQLPMSSDTVSSDTVKNCVPCDNGSEVGNAWCGPQAQGCETDTVNRETVDIRQFYGGTSEFYLDPKVRDATAVCARSPRPAISKSLPHSPRTFCAWAVWAGFCDRAMLPEFQGWNASQRHLRRVEHTTRSVRHPTMGRSRDSAEDGGGLHSRRLSCPIGGVPSEWRHTGVRVYGLHNKNLECRRWRTREDVGGP